MSIHPGAGTKPPHTEVVDIPRLVTAFFAEKPDPSVAAERVSFGTSGHRGSSFLRSFNEAHIVATTHAIALYRKSQGTTGPLFIGKDTHALSEPAFVVALEVLAAHGVEVMIDSADGYTPTPAISHAILSHNRGRTDRFADGIVVTPSHNPPGDGGFKYNPPNGGPADTDATGWIEATANGLLAIGLSSIPRIPYARALAALTTHRHDFVAEYSAGLASVLNLEAIRSAKVKIGADPLGGASVGYLGAIADRYGLDLAVVNEEVDSTFRFMTRDWDGKVRMDCSSPYAMTSLIALADRFDVAFGNDTDADRHGIVVRGHGLMNPNHFLSVAIDYLFRNRPGWGDGAGIGKTLVSSSMIDKVAASLNRRLVEVPVGFKWFVPGLSDGSLGFGGEESAGASFLRKDGTAWSTDKDGILLGLLAAEILAVTGADPAARYAALTTAHGTPIYARIDAKATVAEKTALKKLDASSLGTNTLAGRKIEAVLTHAPGNGAPVGGVKVVTDTGWFAARPSGTEDVMKIYAESFEGPEHLKTIQEEAKVIVARASGQIKQSVTNP